MSDARMLMLATSALMPMPSHSCCDISLQFFVVENGSHTSVLVSNYFTSLMLNFLILLQSGKKTLYLKKDFNIAVLFIHTSERYSSKDANKSFDSFFTVYNVQSTFIRLFQQHLHGCRYSAVFSLHSLFIIEYKVYCTKRSQTRPPPLLIPGRRQVA
jgi:hypothetical protein